MFKVYSIYIYIYLYIHIYIYYWYSIIKCAKSGYLKIDSENDLHASVKSCKTISELETLFRNRYSDKLVSMLQQHSEHILSFKNRSFYNIVKQNGGVDLLQFDVTKGIYYYIILYISIYYFTNLLLLPIY